MLRGKMLQPIFVLGLITTLAIAPAAWANRSSAVIEAPATVSKGTEATIKVTVSHNGNNWFHYTEWAKVTANGKEIARWDYSWSNRPESEVFTKEIKLQITEPTKIRAEASCVSHGGEPPDEKTVQVTE